MKAKGEAPIFFISLHIFLLCPEILKEVKKIYIFLGEGANPEKIL
jgi:hypothetical protein